MNLRSTQKDEVEQTSSSKHIKQVQLDNYVNAHKDIDRTANAITVEPGDIFRFNNAKYIVLVVSVYNDVFKYININNKLDLAYKSISKSAFLKKALNGMTYVGSGNKFIKSLEELEELRLKTIQDTAEEEDDDEEFFEDLLDDDDDYDDEIPF